ncbi:MAG: O-antigen ligase family protein [Elusimicrobia bacterium]|nr:O-antigen ligase family protein [Elusimicrobiota bacterium]
MIKIIGYFKDKSHWLIIFSLFLVSLLPISFIKLEYVNIALTIRILYITSLGILFLTSIKKSYGLSRSELWVAVLIIVWIFSIVPAGNKRNSIMYISEFIVKGYILVFIIPRLIKEIMVIRTILKWIVFLASVITLVGIIEAVAGYNIFFHNLYWQYNGNYLDWFRGGPRGGIVSTIGHPLPLASYLLICFPLACCIYYFTRKKIYIVVAGLLAVAILLSLSRSSTLILIFLLIIMFVIYFNKKKILLYMALFSTLILAIVIIPKYKKNIAMRYAWKTIKYDITSSLRYYSYFTAYNILKDYPVLGVGPGNYCLIYSKYRDPRYPRNAEKAWSTPDNMYLRILTETGLLGFGMFLLFLGNFFKNFLMAYRKFEERNKKLLLSLGLCLVAFLLNILFYDGFDWFAPNLLFWCLWGLTQSLINRSTE